MVGADHFDLRTAEIGKPCGLCERQTFEFGMRVVDDLDSQLDRILATPGLSPNTYEMVSKSLADASG